MLRSLITGIERMMREVGVHRHDAIKARFERTLEAANVRRAHCNNNLPNSPLADEGCQGRQCDLVDESVL